MITQNLKQAEFVIIDTETTGDTPGIDKPIEIAAVCWNIEKGFLDKPKSWLVNPQIPIHPSAMAVHHLMEEDIAEAPVIEKIQPEIEEMVNDKILVAHNASFDMGMLPFLNNQEWVDSLRVARHTWIKGMTNHQGHDLRSHKAQELRYWLGLKVDTMGLAAHRAAADILVTGEVFACAVKKYLELNEGNDDLSKFLTWARAPLQVKRITFGKYKDKELTEIPTDYYQWLLNKVAVNEFKMDDDLKNSIICEVRNRGIEPADLIRTEEKANSWEEVAARRKIFT